MDLNFLDAKQLIALQHWRKTHRATITNDVKPPTGKNNLNIKI